jgi:hypothetical protein
LAGFAHSASLHSRENNAPSKPGIKQLGCSDDLGFLGFPRASKSDSKLIFGDQSWIATRCEMINGNV